MIERFVKAWDAQKDRIRERFRAAPPEDYKDIVTEVIGALGADGDCYSETPDPERVHEIDDGAYQGTLVYVIGEKDYHQPHEYWYVRVWYGSCSGCDTLQHIKYDLDTYEEKLDGYMTLALHIVQRLKKMDGEAV